MNLIWVIVVVILAWMVYMYMKSYDAIANELREIRVKCMKNEEEMNHPIANMRNQVQSAIQAIKPLPIRLRRRMRPTLESLKFLQGGSI
jgi:p-aminobenzoyl-glutamate transporter AbgT